MNDADSGDRVEGAADAADDAAPDAETAKARIRERGRRVCREERERALGRLRERRPLTDREEEVLGSLARSLTEQLLAVPESHLDAVEDGEADSDAAVALALFGEERHSEAAGPQ